MTLSDEIERLDGPSREMDARIDAHFGWAQLPNPTSAGCLFGMMIGPDGKVVRRNVPFYTASLDAAMTLVPEGWGWVVKFYHADARCEARVGSIHGSTAATPALALVAASLRARTEEKGHG